MTAPVDVLAAIDMAIGTLSEDGYDDSEIMSIIEARAAVAELIEASHEYFTCYCVDEADDDCATGSGFDTGCTLEQHEAAKRLRAALARAQGVAP